MQSAFLFFSSLTICFQLPIGHFIHLTNERASGRERKHPSSSLSLYTTLNIHPIVILMMNIISKVCHFNSPCLNTQSQFERQTDILELFNYSKEDLDIYPSSSIYIQSMNGSTHYRLFETRNKECQCIFDQTNIKWSKDFHSNISVEINIS